jgi:hypothetical protein
MTSPTKRVPAWLDGLTFRDWLFDGSLCTAEQFDNLDWSKALVDLGPSPAGNLGPYWRVPHVNGDTRHRLYPKVLKTKWAHAFHQAALQYAEQRIAQLAAAPEPPAEDGWQPIETAPKDCRDVLCYVDGIGMGQMVLYWNDGYWREKANGMGLKITPTHWQPLPAPPALSRQSQQE